MLFKLMWRIIILCTLIDLISCQNKPDTNIQDINSKNDSVINLKYAKHFEIFKLDSGYKINVINPWQFTNNEKFSYIFSKIFSTNNHKIKLPIKRIVCLSTSHIGFLSKLNLQNKIVGVSGIRFINDSITNMLIKENKIVDVGYEQNLNYELILSLKPDIIIAYNVESKNVAYITKLEELGLKVIFVAEYLEETPLAKAEWLKFFGIIFNVQQNADSIFKNIDEEYNNLKIIAQTFKERPSVFAGLPWKDSWYIAGGKSNLACLFNDAGAKYIWENDTSTQSSPISLENVINKVSDADFWLNSGTANSLNDIYLTDSRLSTFKAFKSKKIYNNNAKINSFGGIDYWESGIVNPQIALKDIIKIIHPQSFSNYKTYYYKKLE